MFELQSGENVIYTWSSMEDGETIQEMMKNIKDCVGSNGSVAVETYDNLIDVAFSRSLFEVAILDDSHGTQTDVSLALLGEYLRILKPCGRLIIRTNSSSDTLLSNLKLAGYYKIKASDYAENLTEIEAHKPDYEIGSNIKLTFHNNKYTLDDGAFKLDLEDPDVQLENPDDLLSEEDLQRPDPSSLKVCGTTGKRKACKSCVCGLKEELDAENEAKAKENKDFKPSCGSCYLGDAFRCASCPYLGMPAFKPGEKVKLTEDTMQDDF